MRRVIDVLRERGLSGRAARDAMASGKVRLRGVPIGDGGRMCEPDAVRFDVGWPRLRLGLDPVFLEVRARWVVVWKPSGMLSVRAPGREAEPDVVSVVARQLGQAFAVHRLDEGTSGCLLVARDEPAQQALKAMFETHDVERRYLALVHGQVGPEPRRVRSILLRDRGDGLRGSAVGPVASTAGKPAETELRGVQSVRLRGGPCTLVEALLFTGRTHQVRIHLAEVGAPVLGENLYTRGPATERFPRLALHAVTLGFKDPFDGTAVRWDTCLPDDMDRAVRGEVPSARR